MRYLSLSKYNKLLFVSLIFALIFEIVGTVWLIAYDWRIGIPVILLYWALNIKKVNRTYETYDDIINRWRGK